MSNGILFNTIYEDSEEPGFSKMDKNGSMAVHDPKNRVGKSMSQKATKKTLSESSSNQLFPGLAGPKGSLDFQKQEAQTVDGQNREVKATNNIIPKKIVKPKGYVKNFIIQAIAEIQSKYKTGKGIPIVDINTFPKHEAYNPKKPNCEIEFLNRFIHSRTTSDFITNKLKNTRIILTNGVKSIKFPDDQPVETVAVRTLLQELMDEKVEFERVSFKTRDIGTQVDTSIISMDTISDLYKKLRDDLDITQEMIRMNQRQQLKDNVMKSFGNILNTLKSMRDEIDHSINNERLKCAKEINEALCDIKEENKIFYNWEMEKEIEKNKEEMSKRTEMLKTFEISLKKRQHDLEKIEFKAFKINNIMLKHKLNSELEPISVQMDPQEIIKKYQSEIHTKTEEINDLRFKLSEYGFDDKVVETKEEEKQDTKTRERLKNNRTDNRTTLNVIPGVTDWLEREISRSESLNEEPKPAVDDKVLEMEKIYHQEIENIKQQRAELSSKWVEKIKVALKLQSNSGIKQLLRRQTRLLQFAFDCKRQVEKVDQETQDCLGGFTLQDLKDGKHSRKQESAKIDSPSTIRSKNLKFGLYPLKIETTVSKLSKSQMSGTIKSPVALSPRLKSSQLEGSMSFSKRNSQGMKANFRVPDGNEPPFSALTKSGLSTDLLISSSNSLRINSKPNVMNITDHITDGRESKVHHTSSKSNVDNIGKQPFAKASNGNIREFAKLKDERPSSLLREVLNKPVEVVDIHAQHIKNSEKSQTKSTMLSKSNPLSRSAYSIPVLDISLKQAKKKSKSRYSINELERKPYSQSISKKMSEMNLSQRYSVNTNDFQSLKIVSSVDKLSERPSEVSVKMLSSRPSSARSRRLPSNCSRPSSAKTSNSRKSIATEFVVDYIQQSRPDSPPRSARP